MNILVLTPEKEFQFLETISDHFESERQAVENTPNIFMAAFVKGETVSNASSRIFAKFCYELAESFGMKINTMSTFYIEKEKENGRDAT
jgi:hypothetical protein